MTGGLIYQVGQSIHHELQTFLVLGEFQVFRGYLPGTMYKSQTSLWVWPNSLIKHSNSFIFTWKIVLDAQHLGCISLDNPQFINVLFWVPEILDKFDNKICTCYHLPPEALSLLKYLRPTYYEVWNSSLDMGDRQAKSIWHLSAIRPYKLRILYELLFPPRHRVGNNIPYVRGLNEISCKMFNVS